MSKIVEKAFDASKKIVRSIFRGSPNLITTSDLNRQLEALKYQVDKLDEKTGFIIEGANLGYKLENATLKVSLGYDTMEFKGCSFEPDKTIESSINLTASAPYAYMCLVAEKETVTYDTDTTHEIAGAKFEDGTYMRAADQIRYKNETFVLTHSLESVKNYVGVIAFFRYSNGNIYVNENWTSLYSPLRVMDNSGALGTDFSEPAKSFPPKVGDSYDVAFRKLTDSILNLISQSPYGTTSWASVSRPFTFMDVQWQNVALRFVNGKLVLSIGQIIIPQDSIAGSYFYFYLDVESADEDFTEMYNKMRAKISKFNNEFGTSGRVGNPQSQIVLSDDLTLIDSEGTPAPCCLFITAISTGIVCHFRVLGPTDDSYSYNKRKAPAIFNYKILIVDFPFDMT